MKQENGSNQKPFLSSVEDIRKRAREHMQRGAVTPSYNADIDTVLRLLNEALATELVCVLRYKSHYYNADGIHSQSVAAEFLEHAQEEQGHADQIARRIKQLGGNPNLNPEGILSRSHAQFQTEGMENPSLLEMIEEDLLAERIAIESYREMIQYLSDRDPTSRTMLEGILATEEEHADDLLSLLALMKTDTRLDPKFTPGGLTNTPREPGAKNEEVA